MPDDQPARFAPDEPTPTRAGAARSADWRADTPGAAGNRTVLIVLSLLALLTIAGVVIGVVAFWTGTKPAPRLVSVPVGQYEHPAWPVNPWSRQDADLLASCLSDSPSIEFNSQQRTKFRDLLDQLASPGDAARTGRPLVLHVTALAVVRDRTVYLLPGDAQPDAPTTWVPVADVLDAFGKAAADRGKLLILDLAHPTADPFSGVLRNDVSDRLHELLEAKAADLPYPVLVSCGPGEESLPADAERCSGFAFYLAQGLRGAADGYLSSKTDRGRDGEVSLPELVAFLSGRVSRWARLVHDRKQTPRLYGQAERGPVFRVPSPRSAQPDLPEREPYPKWLADGWQYRADQHKSGADRGLPDSFDRLTAALLRAERDWLRSGDAVRAEPNWEAAKSNWQKALRDSGGPDRAADIYAKVLGAVGRYRLAVARRDRPPAPADWAVALDQYVAAKLAAVPGKPDDSAKFRDEWLKKAQPEKGRENRLDAAGLLWDRFRLSPPTEARAKVWTAALDDLKADGEFSETFLLRSLAAWEPRRQGISEYPKEQAAELLRAEDELSRTLALGPDGFELVREQLDRAKEQYRTGQEDLFHGSFDKVTQAKGRLKQAADGFAAARQALDPWQKAGRELEAAVAVLLDTMPSALTASQAEFDDWVGAVQAVTALADEVAPAGRDRALNPARLAAVRDVRQKLPVVRDPFAVPPGKKEADPLPPRAKPADVLPLRRLVAGTALPADSRRKAWDAIRSDDRAFEEAARGQDEADDAAHDPTTNPTEAVGKDQVGETVLAVRRAGASVALLKLAGYAKAGELEAALGRLERDPASDAGPLGKLLRKAWAVDLPAQAAAAAAAKRWHEAARIARVTPPGAAVLRPAPDVTAARPAAQAAARAYRAWARDQLLADKPPLRPSVPGAAEFYETVRQDLELGPD